MDAKPQRTTPVGRRDGMRRMVGALWLVLYALVAVAVPVADAAASHAPVTAHWEDGSDTSCPPRHDASACQLCQAGGSVIPLPPEAPSLRIAESDAAPLVTTGRADASQPPDRGTPPSRAPPQA